MEIHVNVYSLDERLEEFDFGYESDICPRNGDTITLTEQDHPCGPIEVEVQKVDHLLKSGFGHREDLHQQLITIKAVKYR